MTRYYRTVVTIEVLGLDPYRGGADDVSDDIRYGNFSGAHVSSEVTEVTEEEMAELLRGQGSDPSFLIRETEDDTVVLADPHSEPQIAMDAEEEGT